MVDSQVLSARGLENAALVLNKIPSDVIGEMCQEVMQFLLSKKGNVDIECLRNAWGDLKTRFHPLGSSGIIVVVSKHSSATGCDYQVSDIQTAVHGITYIFREASRGKWQAEKLRNQLTSSSLWTKDAIDALVSSWAQQGAQLTNLGTHAEHMLSVGRLVDLQWKLGIATSSSCCRNLSSLFVTLTLKVADPSGTVTTRSFEMTVPEFQNFSRQIQSISLDAV